MSEKADPAVATAHQAAAQFGIVPQNRPQRDLILTNKRPRRIVPVPVGAKLENLFEAYEKKDRFCVTIRMVFSMSSSYRLNAKSLRGEGEDFFAARREIPTAIPAIGTRVIRCALLPLPLIHSASLHAFLNSKDYLEKRMGMTRVDRKPNHFFFQVVGDLNRATPGEFS